MRGGAGVGRGMYKFNLFVPFSFCPSQKPTSTPKSTSSNDMKESNANDYVRMYMSLIGALFLTNFACRI